MLSNRHTEGQTDRQTDPSTVTLAAHECRGLTTFNSVLLKSMQQSSTGTTTAIAQETA